MTDLALVASLTLVALLLVGAFAAAVETVLTRLNVVRALRLAEGDARGAQNLLWILEHRATSLEAFLVITVSGRIGFTALTVWLGASLGGGVRAVTVALVLAVVISLVFTEVLPRTVALRHLEATGRAISGVARIVVRIVEPFAKAIVAIGRALVPRQHEVSGPHASDDELRALEHSEEEQDEEIEPEERAMIRSIFELADTIVREVMVPRPDMVTVSERASLEEVLEVIVDHGFSRLPVDDADDSSVVVGVVYAKDLLRRISSQQSGGRWSDLVRPPTFVPETKRVDELLRELQSSAVHLALVVDEYGQIVGLITIEDILEEIVGEIIDEHDHEEALVEPLEDGRILVDARLGVDDLNEILDAGLPEEGWDTVGGLVFGTLGRVPIEGEQVELDGIVITVERVQGRRVVKVVVDPSQSDDQGEDAAGSTDPEDSDAAESLPRMR